MEKFSLPEFELCAKRIYFSDIIEEDYSKIVDKLSAILYKCKNYDGENYIEIIFRQYILMKTATEVFQYIRRPSIVRKADDITQIIVYKQSSDADINILAKVKCLEFGSGYKDFLRWQICRLFIDKEIDLLNEYKSYKMSKGISDYVIPNMLSVDKE